MEGGVSLSPRGEVAGGSGGTTGQDIIAIVNMARR
jgi:hypothetical protein